MGEPLCKDCPDHEACMTGYPCEVVKKVDKESQKRNGAKLSSYKNRPGVWVTYDYDQGPYVMVLHLDVVDAARDCAQRGSGKVLFWPYEMTFQSAVHEWETVDV